MLDKDNIYEFLNNKENKNIEFKEAKNVIPKGIFETYSAFANSVGGYIILGIKELREGKNVEYSIVGVDNVNSLCSQLWNNFNNPQKVSMCILNNEDIYTLEIEHLNIIVIHVPIAKYNQKPIYVGVNPYSGTYKRNFEGDYHCDKETVNAMIRDSYTHSNDDEIIDYLGIEDIDMDALSAYRNRFKYTNEGHIYDGLDDKDFLRKIGAYKIDKKNHIEGLTRAGILMFGTTETFNDLYNHVKFDYRNETNLIGDMRWSDRVIENGLWEKNIYNFITKVYPKIISEFEVPFQMIDSLQRTDESRLHTAAREALANSLIHADYNEYPCNIVIVKKDDYINYSNSGLLRMPIEDVLSGGNSLPRNITIHRLLRFIGFGENAGSGYDKILAPSKYEDYKTPELSIKESIRETNLKLWTIKSTDKVMVDLSNLTVNQLMVYNVIKSNPGLNSLGIKKLCDLKESKVDYAIKQLRKNKIIHFKGKGTKLGGYFINE